MVIGFFASGGLGRDVYESRIYYWGARVTGAGAGAAFAPNLTFFIVIILDFRWLLVTFGYWGTVLFNKRLGSDGE